MTIDTKPCQGCAAPVARRGTKGPWPKWCADCLVARRYRQAAESRERLAAASEAGR